MLWAVHISDGILKPHWLLAGFGGTILIYLFGAWRLREIEIPRIALLTAVFFILTTIHVRVGPTTVHLLGTALVGVILGRRAGLAIAVGLLLQATLPPGHGGLQTLGVNTCIITLPALGAWQAFRLLQPIPWNVHQWGRSLLVGAAVLIGVLCAIYTCTALAFNLLARADNLDLSAANWTTFHPITLAAALALAIGLSWVERLMENAPEFPLGLLIGEITVLATLGLNFLILMLGSESTSMGPLLIMLVAHLPLAVIEGFVLGMTLGFLMRVKPDMLSTARQN